MPVFKNCQGLTRQIVMGPLWLALAFSPIGGMLSPAYAQGNAQIIQLNNEGVNALNSGNYQLAMSKFEQALRLDPSYDRARDNLAIAHNNYGLALKNTPKEALKQFHIALYIKPSSSTTLQNIEGIIRMLGKNPQSFKDRVELADQERLSGDFIGALIEYGEAVKIEEDPKLRIKMGDIYRVRDENDKAINQYQTAARVADSAEIEVKLGQAFQAKKDVPNAIAAYAKALQLKADDPDVLDALVAGWEEALKENPLAPENHIGLGQAFQYRGDFGQAAEEFKQAIRLSPGRQNQTAERLLANLPRAQRQATVDKHLNAGVDLQSRKLYDQAEQEYKIALEADRSNPSVWLNLGTLYQAQEKYDLAVSAYNQCLKLEPGNSAAQQGLKTAGAAQTDKVITDATTAGALLFKQGRYDEAVAKYIAVLKINPKDAESHYNLGTAYQAKKDFDAAIGEYRQAIAIDPDKADYGKALAAALDAKAQPVIDAAVTKHKQKDYAGAIELYQQALTMRPANASLWYDLASAQYAKQDYLSARESYQRALAIDRKHQIDDLYFIATIDEHYGKGDDSLKEYRQYLGEAASGRYASLTKERIAALAKNINDTIRIKSESELAQIKEAEDAASQAVKLQQSGSLDQALALYQKAISLQPKNADYIYGLGTVYQAKQNADQAIDSYQKALQIDPNNKDYKNALAQATALKVDPIIDQGVTKQTANDLNGAIALYNQALELAPRNARAHTNLGTAYQQLDDFQKARGFYQSAYELDPKSEVGDLYLMATIDENNNQGAKALGEYQRYIKEAPAGQYQEQARTRISALNKNINDTAKLTTQAAMKSAKEAEDAYNEAVKLQESNKYDDAISLYLKAISLQPRQDAFVYALGTCYQAKGDINNALDAYQKAIAINPKKDYKDALESAKSQQSQPIMDQAAKKYEAGDFVGAIALYKQALSMTPNNAHAWTIIAAAYQQNGDYALALQAYQKALEIDPKAEAEDWYFIGLLDENAGSGARALQDYQRYAQLVPKGAYAAQAHDRISALRLNPSKTEKLMTESETQKSADAQAAYDQAVKLQQDNKLDEAIAQYNKAIAANASEPSYYYSLGTCYQAKNDLDTALSNYRKAAGLNPSEPSYKDAIKQLLATKAQPLVDSAIKKQTANDIRGAIADYEAALRISDDAGTHSNLGTAYQALNNLNKAIAEYKRALQLDPKFSDAHYFLGTAHETTNQKPLAIAEYEQYLRLAANGPYANDVKQRLKVLKTR